MGDAESSAEDLVDYALSGDRDKVIAAGAALQATAAGPAAAALRSAGTPERDIAKFIARANRVARVARSGSFVTAALAANGISQLMPAFYSRFASTAPPSVLALDYLDREAQLRSIAGRSDRIPAIVSQLASTWVALRPDVVAAGGVREAAAFTRHVVAMRTLSPTSSIAIQKEAVNGLNLVDDIEGVFRR